MLGTFSSVNSAKPVPTVAVLAYKILYFYYQQLDVLYMALNYSC